MRLRIAAACLAAVPACSAAWAPARAEDAIYRPPPERAVPANPFAQCDAAISAAAKRPARLPSTLLPAIARVESGRLDAATGRVRPWPWTINVDGVGYFYETKADVIAAVKALQARGKRSIDVGCMQVNLLHHPTAFPDLDKAFDPAANATYAVSFLMTLYQQTRDWPLATAYYHSATPDLGEEYQRLVFGKVVTPMGGTGAAKPNGAWPSSGERFAAIPPIGFQLGAFAQQRPVQASFGGVPTVSIGTYPNLMAARPGSPLGLGTAGQRPRRRH